MKRMLLIGALAGLALSLDLGAQDARGVVDAASRAMGTATLQGVSYSATGSSYSVGQNYTAGGAWPRFTVTKYDAALNFGGPVMREEFVRVDDENPPKGGGAGPYIRRRSRAASVRSRSARRRRAQCATGGRRMARY